jgi:hypothetical protein
MLLSGLDGFGGDAFPARESAARLRTAEDDAGRAVSDGAPSAADREVALDAMSPSSVESVMRFLEEDQYEEHAESPGAKRVLDVLGTRRMGVHTVEGVVQFSAKSGEWRFRLVGDGPRAAFLPLDDPTYPDRDEDFAEIRETLQTREFLQYAAYEGRTMDHSETLGDAYAIGKAKYDELREKRKALDDADAAAADADAAADAEGSSLITEDIGGVEVKYRPGSNFGLALVKSILYGFINGALFGLADGFLDAVNHESCAPHRAKLKLAFQRVLDAVAVFFRGLFSASARDGKSRTALFRAVLTSLACFFRSLVSFVWRCKPLLIMLGMIIAVVGVALIINLALVATGYGILVKIVEIAMTLWGMWSVFKANFERLRTVIKRCVSAGRCSRGQVLTIVEAATEIVGLVVGSIYLGGISRILKVSNVKAALQGRNLRLLGFKLDPQISLQVAQFGRKISNAKQLITATGSAVRSRSMNPIKMQRAAIRAESSTRAAELYASARSLADDASQASRLASVKAHEAKASYDALSAQLKAATARARRSTGGGGGMPAADVKALARLESNVGRAEAKLDLALRRAQTLKDSQHQLKTDMDGFVRDYSAAFKGKKPSIKMADGVFGVFRNTLGERQRFELAVNIFQREQMGLATVNARLNRLPDGSPERIPLLRDLVKRAARLDIKSHAAHTRLEAYSRAVRGSLDSVAGADDFTINYVKMITAREGASKASFLDAASRNSLHTITEAYHTVNRGAAASTTSSSSSEVAALKAKLLRMQNQVGMQSTTAYNRAASAYTKMMEQQTAFRALLTQLDTAATAAHRAVLGAVAAQEAKQRSRERSEAGKQSRERAKKLLEDLKLEDRLRDRLQDKYEVTLVVKAGASVARAERSNGFFVVAELLRNGGSTEGDGASPQRGVTPEGEGVSPVFSPPKPLQFHEHDLTNTSLRLYLFEALGDTLDLDRQESDRTHLIGIATVPGLEEITDRGTAIEMQLPVIAIDGESTVRDVQSLAEEVEREQAALEARKDGGGGGAEERSSSSSSPASAAIAAANRDGADDAAAEEQREPSEAEKRLEAALVSGGTLIVDVSILLRGAPGLTDKKQTFTIPGTPPAMSSPQDDIAMEIASAMDGAGTYDERLARAIVSIRGPELMAVRISFRAQFNGDIVEAVRADTSGYYSKLLVRLLTRPRVAYTSSTSMNAAVLAKAREAHAAMSQWGTDEDKLLKAIAYGDWEFNRELAKRFRSVYSKDLMSYISDETSGWFRFTLKILLEPAHKPACSDV